MKSKFLIAGVATVAVAGAISMAAPAAQADPTPAGTFRTYVATGSDTTQDVWNALSNVSPQIKDVASYDAFPQGSYIQTQSGGNSWLRPSGSGNGVKFLSAAYDTSGSYTWPTSTGSAAVPTTDVSFARSSSGPTTGANDDLTYIPFARDAVSVAYYPKTTGSPTLTGLNLTTSELNSLYSGVDVSGDQVTFSGTGTPLINSVPVQPKIPQQGSGTRSFFLGAIGVGTLASYISDPVTGGLAENDGGVLTTVGDLIPFSAAQWIAQTKGTVTSTVSGLEIASINGSAPTTGSGVSTAPGALFGGVDANGLYNTVPTGGAGSFNRDTYNVVPSSFFGGSATAAQITLRTKLTSAGSLADPGVVSAGAKTKITNYGFGNLSYVTDSTKYKHGIFLH